LPRPRGLRVLDLGAGTGIYARTWPRWGAAHVWHWIAPCAMLDESKRVGFPEAVTVVRAEDRGLPLASASIDVAWLSAVIHHVRTARRVQESYTAYSARRSRAHSRFFRGHSSIGWLPFFPRWETAISRFPSVGEIAELFRAAGFDPMAGKRSSSRTQRLTWFAAGSCRCDGLTRFWRSSPMPSSLLASPPSATRQPVLSGSLHVMVLTSSVRTAVAEDGIRPSPARDTQPNARLAHGGATRGKVLEPENGISRKTRTGSARHG